MNDLQLERQIRDTLRRRAADVMDPRAVPPERPVLRQARRRQFATVITVVVASAAVVATSLVGVEALLRSSSPGVPATPPEVLGQPTVLRAMVTWDGETCTYEGPHEMVADPMLASSQRQRLRITFEDRSTSAVALVVAKLSHRASFERFLRWSATHEPSFYGSFPPRRFLVPGSMQIVDYGALQDGMARIGPFDDAGRYYLACLGLPASERGGTLHPAALLTAVEGS